MELHAIGNAHLDPVWLWDWREGYQEVKATFRSALDRMNEYPEFVFTCSAACYYQWVEENEPTMFEEIRRRVREGRWVLVGGWWIQPDCNTPCGESFARQALVAQRYFLSRFGKRAVTAYNVDSFGHAGTLPQIMKLSGLTQYVYMRPMKHEKEMPANLFEWASADGSAIPAYRIPVAYCTWEKELRERLDQCASQLPGQARGMFFYGVGNHGGGPTKENLNCLRKMREEGVDVFCSSPDRFFDAVRASGTALPRVTGELLHHASGCYSAHSGVKKWNRDAENRLLAAEKWSCISRVALCRPYPTSRLNRAWKRVLFNQFHDILAGTSLERAYDDARNQYGEAIALSDDAMNEAMQTIAWHVNIDQIDETRPLVVFNHHAFDATLNVVLQAGSVEGMELRDNTGEVVPHQSAECEAAINGRATLLFQARVPALGYRLYRLCPAKSDEREAAPETGLTLDNGVIRAVINEKTGLVDSITRLCDAKELLSGAAGTPVVIEDKSDTWSHAVFSFPDEIGRFALRALRRTEFGPVRQTIRAEYAWGASTIIAKFSLWAGADELDMNLRVNWQEHEKMLKLEFPVAGDAAQSAAEVPFGHATRPADGIEYPMHRWAALGNLAVENDSKYSYSAKDGKLSLTCLRSPRYAHHTPYVPPEDSDYPFMDQGWQSIGLRLGVNGAPSVLTRRAESLNLSAYALFETGHAGELPPEGSFARLEAKSIHLSALKQAEDGSGDLIAHLWESDGTQASGALWLCGARIPLSMKPYEIAALRIAMDGTAQRVNLLEEEI